MDKIISENSEQVIEKVSNSIIALAKECIRNKGKFTIALSGGNTPKLLYKYMINKNLFKNIDLSKIFIYFSDERYVAHDDERSNYGLAKKNLLNYLNIPDDNIFPVNTSFTKTSDSAVDYQNVIMSNITARDNEIPTFDLVILGMGADGHTASLFPESALLSVSDCLVGSCFHGDSNTDRISFTFPLINAAKNVFIIAIGKEKFSIIGEIKNAEQNNILKYPIQQVRSNENLKWFVDKAAELGI